MPALSPQRVVAAVRALGSLLPRARRRRRDASRLVHPWRADSDRTYPGTSLTPRAAAAVLQAADAGQPQSQFEFFREMLEKWPRLSAVEATRRLALTGLEWEITPGPAATPAAADYCRDVLSGLSGFRAVLNHLAEAIGHGIAVAELVWERGQLADIVPVPHTRLLSDPHEPWRLRVRTAEAPALGVLLDAWPAKWIVHRPHAAAAQLFGGGLLRRSVPLYLAQHLSLRDWLIFSQIAGMPLRVGRFDTGTPESEQRQLLQMLQALGTDAVAVIGKHIELQLVEAARGERPYRPLQEYCNTEVTILWLGQHLTTDLRQSGSRAAAEIHDRVREDLLVDDIAEEGETIGRDVLAPLVAGRFGTSAGVPRFRRSLVEAVDTRVLADTLAVAVNGLGLRVPRAWAHRALGVPEAGVNEAVLASGER